MSGNKIHIAQLDHLILANSIAPLGSGIVFEGDVLYVGGYSHISGYVFSNVASAANGLIIEQAADRDDFASGVASTTLVTVSTTAIAAGNIVDNALAVQIVAPFAKIVYINGGSAQASFRIFFSAKALRGL